LYQADLPEVFLTIQVPFVLIVGRALPVAAFVPVHGAWHSDGLIRLLISVIKMPPLTHRIEMEEMGTGTVFEVRLTVPVAGILIYTIIEVISVTLNENGFLESIIHGAVSIWTIPTLAKDAFAQLRTVVFCHSCVLTSIKTY